MALPITTFWDLVHRLQVPRFVYGRKCVRFEADVIERLRGERLVRSEADELRLIDKRRRTAY